MSSHPAPAVLFSFMSLRVPNCEPARTERNNWDDSVGPQKSKTPPTHVPAPPSAVIPAVLHDTSIPAGGTSADVVVVGAGLSGLRAAALLKRQGYSVVVLEASDRVGGRLKPFFDASGVVWDMGGQWVGPQQHRMHTLLREYNIPTVPQYDDTVGKLVIVNAGARSECVLLSVRGHVRTPYSRVF